MTTPRDPDRLIRAFLDEGPAQLPDRSYDAVRAQVDRTRQHVVLGSLGGSRTRGVVFLAMAAAAVLIVVVAGSNLLSSFGLVGGPAASAVPTPAASSPVTTNGGPGPDPNRAIEPGSYVLSTPQVLIHLTMPAGWSGDATGINLFPGTWTGMLGLRPFGHDISYVLADACANEADVDLVAVGPTVADLTAALADQTGIQRKGPTDVMLGRYPAKKFVLTLLPACPERNGLLADAARTYDFGLRHGETGTVYVVDVDGRRLVITSQYGVKASAEHIAQLEAITASIDLEPVASAGTLPGLAGGGSLPVGRHDLTIDGVPLSFSVPALVINRGWDRYRDIYISKDTVGPQGAEGAIYWTAFPDGVGTDPCASLQSLPIDSSAVELTAAVAAAPGVELVSGPSDVTIGGRAAKYVVLTVREDLGCDPGFFFTWAPAPGGPAWWSTNVGDTISLWAVNVDGKLFVIASETTPNAGTRTKQEILEIVDSIKFE